MGIRDFFNKLKGEEPIEERVDPVIEQRRKEKFSSPLIYNEEVEEKVIKEEKKEPVKKEIVQPKKVKVEVPTTQSYTMSEIISPMTGKTEKEDHVIKPNIKKTKRKRTVNLSDQLVPVISPFYGAKEQEEEKEEIKPVEKEVKKEKKIKKEPESVTENLRNLANIIKEEENQLKIIEARTGEFQLDFSNVQGQEKTLIDEINDEMTLDELMSLYEKKKLKE